MANRTYTVKVGRRGYGLWVRIPAAIMKELNIKVGDVAEIVAVRELSFEVRHVSRGGNANDKGHVPDSTTQAG